jgi:hypothetical protein
MNAAGITKPIATKRTLTVTQKQFRMKFKANLKSLLFSYNFCLNIHIIDFAIR